MFHRALLRRILPHGLVFFVAWPLASTLAATIDLETQTATARLPWPATFEMLMRAQPRLASEWLFVASIGALFSILVFAGLATLGEAHPLPVTWLWIEPPLLLLAVTGGIATEYPAVLAHPFLRTLRPVPVLAALLAVIVVPAGLFLLLGTRSAGIRGGAAWLAAFLLIFAGAAAAARAPSIREPGADARGSIALLGIDSLSQADDLSPLATFVAARGGTWYTRITPGLVTNAVWSAILGHRRVAETGVWTICMSVDWSTKPYDLVAAAHRANFLTRSYFSDQFTSYVGTEAGFDVDRSGPMGWLQLATATLKQNSVFLAIALPRLPHLPGAGTPRNQSGTLAFDIPAELDDMLSGDSRQLTFSAGHLDYLHQPLYPRFDELSPKERRFVLSSPVAAVEDLSFDWQYPRIPGDSLGLYSWKVRHVQELVTKALERTGFLDPRRRNRLVIFSDHGSRRDLTVRNFARPGYWNVPLATFGTPTDDGHRAISLLEIPRLLGLADPTGASIDPAAVEFAGVESEDIPKLAPAFAPDGRIFLDPRVLARIGERIREYRPFSDRVPTSAGR